MIVWALQTKRLVIVVFLQRARNERPAATGTRDYYSNYFFIRRKGH